MNSVLQDAKDDPDVVLKACCNDASDLQYASDRLKKSKAFALTLARYHLCCLEYLDPELREDQDVVLLFVANNGHNLDYVADKFKKDPMVLRLALNQLGPDIRVASEETKKLLAYLGSQ